MKNKIKDLTSSLGGDDDDAIGKTAKGYKGKFGKMLADLNTEEKSALEDLIIRCLETGDDDVMEIFVEPILQKKKFMAWKNKGDLLRRMMGKIVEVSKQKAGKARFNGLVEKLLEMLDAYQITKNYKKELIEIMRLSFLTATPDQSQLHLTALNVFNKFPWADKASATEVMLMATRYVDKYGSHPEDSVFNNNLMSFTMFAYYMRGNDLEHHKEVLSEVSKCFVRSSGKDWEAEDEPGKNNLHRSFVLYTLQYFVQTSNGTKADLLKPMFSCIKEFRGSTGDEEIEELVTKLFSDVADNEGCMGEDVGGLLEEFVEGRNDALAHKLKDIYMKQPDSFEPHLESLSALLKVPNDSTCSSLVMFFTEVAKLQPQSLHPSTSLRISKILDHQWYYSLALMYFDALAASCPHDVILYEDDIIQTAVKYDAGSSLVAMMLPKMAVDDEKKRKYLEYLSEESTKKKATPYLACYLNSMRMIGITEPKLLKSYKNFYLDLLDLPTARDLAQSSLDIIEGRSLQKVSEKTDENRVKIDKVDDDVGVISGDVEGMKGHMDEMDESVDGLRRDVDENGMRIDGLDVRVDDAEQQVKEIDHKTLSHAPSWSRDVSKLLNNQSEDKDWKLLGRRLGYSGEDLANWSLHADPCMALLDDWFAKNNAREATRGVLSILDDMQAMEAWRVVDEAVKKAEDIICDEEEEEVTRQPVVFLSYQWAHQNQVKLLRKHLEMCGFPCWMDVGQMGGGDKLYRKIDEGMRRVKVVLCCISSRYAESPNCNREVSLAVTLGKPMIPLLMEDMKWPPVGGMGPIFGEFLYIQFFKKNEGSGGKGEMKNEESNGKNIKRGEKESNRKDKNSGKKEKDTKNKNVNSKEGGDDDDVYWPPDNFQQLAIQIQSSVPADFEVMPEDSPYKKWFNPPKEHAKGSTYRKSSMTSNKSNNKTGDDRSKDGKKTQTGGKTTTQTAGKTTTQTAGKTTTQTAGKTTTQTAGKTTTQTAGKTTTQTGGKTTTQPGSRTNKLTGSKTSLFKAAGTINTKWQAPTPKNAKK